jgi:Mce-associated membrane protein
VEVDAGRAGGEPVTPEPPSSEDSRVGLNITLWVVVIVCAVGAIWFGQWNWDKENEPQPRSVSSDFQAGDRIGDAQVEAVPLADDEEQERTAAVIDAATKMANAFLNLDYEDVDASAEAVLSMATGAFRTQYQQSTEGLEKVAKRAKSVQTGEVVWAGVVAVDDDSATVIVASSGSVSNTTTKLKAVPRSYRLQLDLTLEDGQWLTRDLQFVA